MAIMFSGQDLDIAAQLRLVSSRMVCLRARGGRRASVAGSSGRAAAGAGAPGSGKKCSARKPAAAAQACCLACWSMASISARACLSFPSAVSIQALPPAWILVLWLQFAMSLHYSLGWLTGRYFLGALLGSVSGALAYWAGVRFGAAAFGAELVHSLVQIGLSWGLTMLILLKVSMLTAPRKDLLTYRCFQAN